MVGVSVVVGFEAAASAFVSVGPSVGETDIEAFEAVATTPLGITSICPSPVFPAPRVFDVTLNGEKVAAMDMSLWKSATKNPDGSDIPSWLSKPLNTLPTKGKIGLQGKHAGAPIYFRNVRIKSLD